MSTIRNYTNTKCDLETAKARLSILIDKKTALYNKYFPVTSKTGESSPDKNKSTKDKMTLYMHDLLKIDPNTGKSLEDEINEQLEEVHHLANYLSIMDSSVEKLKGIEADLYNNIVFKGMKITKAVEKVAEEYDKDVTTIWRLYHKTIKKDVQKLKMPVKCQ